MSKAMNVSLPDEPTDGTEVTLYVMLGAPTYRIVRRRYVYHVNTPWSEYEPKRSGGKDLVDCWMSYSGDSKSADGRSLGWLSVMTRPTNDWFDDYHDARNAALAGLRALRRRLREQLDEADEKIDEYVREALDESRRLWE